MDLGEGAALVATVMELTDRLETTVLNDPRRIIGTDRETMARRLSGIDGLVMPPTLRTDRAGLSRLVQEGGVGTFPLIIRHAGTHGGDMMELVDDSAALLQFAEEAGEHMLYLTDYVDYSSTDGYFRKYRFLFVGEEILPYHLAIGDGWKVHHASTRMGEVEWMRDEEAAFLDAPEMVFGPEAMAALDAIRREVGLDYFGIDCGLDRQGRVVVFEVNASMLIHLRNEGFEYKNPHVHRIQKAFERMLESRAGKRGE
jgi:glutathione synthase/RimK-type ligase-like ATP-grasp enzyme